MRRRLLAVLLIVSLIAISGVVIAVNRFDQRASWDGAVPQIKFSHKLHLEGVGAECATCHPAAPTSENANDTMLPTHEECGTCHVTFYREYAMGFGSDEKYKDNAGKCHQQPGFDDFFQENH